MPALVTLSLSSVFPLTQVLWKLGRRMVKGRTKIIEHFSVLIACIPAHHIWRKFIPNKWITPLSDKRWWSASFRFLFHSKMLSSKYWCNNHVQPRNGRWTEQRSRAVWKMYKGNGNIVLRGFFVRTKWMKSVIKYTNIIFKETTLIPSYYGRSCEVLYLTFGKFIHFMSNLWPKKQILVKFVNLNLFYSFFDKWLRPFMYSGTYLSLLTKYKAQVNADTWKRRHLPSN